MPDRHNPPRGWRGTPAGGTPASGASYRPAASSGKSRQIFTVLAVMLALAGVVAGLLYLLRPSPKPYFIPVFITEYKYRQIPVNSQAERDRQALVDGNYFEHGGTFGSQEKDQLVKVLGKLNERKSSDALVLYVCAFARASEKGEVLLLPGDFNPDDSQSAVSLRDALQMVRECPAAHKLLILDTMRPLADPRLGVLTDDVASRIAQELKSVDDPHFMVLLSCSPGQVSLASEDLGRSVFGFYVEEGLRGWADGSNAEGKRDGHVSARELAEFVKRRVDRWAEHNFDTRQTPILLPKDATDDFQIIALEHGQAQTELPAPELAEYPELLRKAWKNRDDAWDDGGFQLAPRAFRELEAALIRAELQWRGGMDLERLKKDLQGGQGPLDRFQDQLKQAREFFLGSSRALTEARSGTLAQALGQKPDPAIVAAVKEMVIKAADILKGKPQEADPALKKLVAEFLEKYKGKQFDIACVVFDQAKDDATPTVDKIRFLASLLQAQDPQARYVETLAIYRWADMANYLRNWPAATVHRSLMVVAQGELAVSRPRVLPWIRSLLDDAAQDRHTAEVFLWTPGCVSLAAAEDQLRKAAEKYDKIIDFEDTLVQAHRALDEAMIRLPAYLPYLESPRHADEAWREAAQSALELREALAQYPDPKQKLTLSDLAKKINDIRQKSESLRSRMDDLRRPFTSENLQQLMTRSKQPDANASVCVDIQSMLATPILKISDRVALWNAGRALSARLNEETLKQDEDEDQRRQATKALSDFEQDQERWERTQRERAGRRASWSIALLKLSGLPAAEVEKLEESRKQATAKTDATAWDSFAASLRKAWVADIPRFLDQETRLAAKDRLNVPYPPFDIGVDGPNPNAFLMQLTLELKEWLTRWYRYKSQDMAVSGFYGESEKDYRIDGRLNVGGAAEIGIQFSGDVQVTSLTPAHPLARVALQLKLVGASPGQPLEVNVFTADDDWLQVSVDKRDLAKLTAAGTSCTLPIDVALKAGAQNSTAPAPQGFLVQARVNDRDFHHKVPVSLVPRPEILLSTNPAEPKDPLNELALRPGKERLKYFLYIRNQTEKPYKLKVELLDNGELVDGGTYLFPEPLKPHDFKRIEFGKAPASEKPFKDMQGPLQIRLVDLDTNKEIDTKQIPVRIANPRDYIEVTNAVFRPNAGGKNNLTVTVRPKKNIPEGCQVKLVLPPDRIPGYTPSREEGKFSETLTKKEEPKTLTATGIQLDEGSDPNGFFYLTVDGVPRAFIYKTTFNRDGGETRPDRFDSFDIRFQTPPGDWYFNSNEKFEVEVNVDNPPEGAKVLLELAEDGTPNVDRSAGPVEARYQHLGMSPISPDGALLFEANIGDRSIPLDIHDIVGKRIVRAILKNSEGAPIKTYSKPITLDNSEPINLKVVQAEEIANGMAEISVRGEDPESDIKAVRFYLGKPAGKKPPANAAPIDANYDKEKKAWTKQIPIPQPGEVDLTAEFVNNVDLTAVKALKVTMTNPNAGAGNGGGPVKLGRIKGTVKNGDRRQPGAKVTLQGPKLKDPLIQEADQTGEFSFPKVPPGTYKLIAVDMFGQAKGSADVTVESDKLATKDVAISR
jgi:hypothetical protein